MSFPSASARVASFFSGGQCGSILPRAGGARHEFLHVEGGPRIHHGAARRDGEHGERVGEPAHEIARALDRIERDVGLEGGDRTAEPLAALRLGAFASGRLADHHYGIDIDLGERAPHGVERGAATLTAVAPPIQLKAAQAARSVTRRREKTSAGLTGPEVSHASSLSPSRFGTVQTTRLARTTRPNSRTLAYGSCAIQLADQFAPGAGLGNQFGIVNSNVTPNEQNFPIFSPSSYIGIGQTRSLPIFRRENTFQYLDNMSATIGKHTLKWGVDFRRRQLTIYQTNQGNGRFNFSPAFTDSDGFGR